MADTWFYSNWAYRNKITVTNTGALLEDYYLLVQFDTATEITANRMRSDCKDILICGQTNGDPLWRYINPDTENTATTDIWIKCPSLPNGDTIIYMYYGFENAILEDSPYEPNPYQAPIESHKELDDLAYDDCGHTGFAPASSVITWNEINGATNAVVNNGYSTDNVARVELTLPATASLFAKVEISGKGAGGWKIKQNAGQTIHMGNLASTTGIVGYLESDHFLDGLRLMCITANTDWKVMYVMGNITIN